MNLTLNLENKTEVNPNLAECSQPPVIINDDATATIKYKGMYRDDSHESEINLLGKDLNNLFDLIDANDFAYETGMRDIVNFKEKLDAFNMSYSALLESMGIDFEFGVTKKYAYKRGTYEMIKKIINQIQKFNMRPSGVNSLFNRIDDNKWVYNNFKDKIYTLNALREKAKYADGSLVTNLDELVQTQSLAYDTIIESTEEANQMSDNFTIIHGIESNFQRLIELGKYTKVNLYTIVKCKSKEMTIVDNNNTLLCKMRVPECILLFKRPLWRTLTSTKNWISEYIGASPGARHPYLNNSSYYNYDLENLTKYAWGSLCLSAYQDDVLMSLNNRDYKSFVMGLMNWNNIYNKDSTNPYASITSVMSHTGFPKQKTDDDTDRLITSIGFSMKQCWKEKYRNHRITEDDYDQRGRNDDINYNYGAYVDYILDSCDKQECPLRDRCSSYLTQNAFYKSDWPEILENYVGFKYSNDSKEATAYYYQNTLSSFSRADSEACMQESIYNLISNLYNKDGYDYYGNKKEEPVPEVPIDVSIEEMQARVSAWQTHNQGG